MRIIETPFGSNLYRQAVDLRREILRKPLGLDFDQKALADEGLDLHLVALNEESELLGCLILSPVGPREIKMRQVAVAARKQSQGVGRALVEGGETKARLAGYETMVLSARNSAVPFYRKLGYELVGEEFIEVTLPHHKMRKRLG